MSAHSSPAVRFPGAFLAAAASLLLAGTVAFPGNGGSYVVDPEWPRKPADIRWPDMTGIAGNIRSKRVQKFLRRD